MKSAQRVPLRDNNNMSNNSVETKDDCPMVLQGQQANLRCWQLSDFDIGKPLGMKVSSLTVMNS